MADAEKITWINLVNPTEADLSSESLGLTLHPLVVEDILHPHQRPKLEKYDDYNVLVAKPARLDVDSRELIVGEVLLVLNPTHLISIRQGEAIHQLADLLPDDGPTKIDRKDQFKIIHGVLDTVVDTYLDIGDHLESRIGGVEHEVFSSDFKNQSENIYYLKRNVLDLLRVVEPLLEPLTEITVAVATDAEKEATTAYFRDVLDHCKRLVASLDRNSALLSDVLSANLSQISIVQNNEMRRMSAWATVFLVPTLFAGIWGMNFQFMPELKWTYGYPFAIGVMLLTTIGLWLNFRRIHWVGPTPDEKAPV